MLLNQLALALAVIDIFLLPVPCIVNRVHACALFAVHDSTFSLSKGTDPLPLAKLAAATP
jgi:hypothetical protein